MTYKTTITKKKLNLRRREKLLILLRYHGQEKVEMGGSLGRMGATLLPRLKNILETLTLLVHAAGSVSYTHLTLPTSVYV